MRVSPLIQLGVAMFRQLANWKKGRADGRLYPLRNFPSLWWLSHREREPLLERKADSFSIHAGKRFLFLLVLHLLLPLAPTSTHVFPFLSPTGLKCYISGLRLRSRTYSTRSSSVRWQVDSRRRRHLQPPPASAPAHRMPGGPRRDG